MKQTKLCEEDCFRCGYETATDEEREEYIAKRHLGVSEDNIQYAYTEWVRVEEN